MTPPIMVRAEITDAEWKRLRKLALDLNRDAKELVGIGVKHVLKNPPPKKEG